MKLTMRLTLDGLLRALRTRGAVAAEERAEDLRKREADGQAEVGDERRA